MNRTHVLGVFGLTLLAVFVFWWVNGPSSTSSQGPQLIEVVAQPPIDLERIEQRELLALTIQKLSTFGKVRSGLESEISIPEFVGAGANTTLLLAQRQTGTWNDVAARQDLVRLMAQIRGRLGGAKVKTGLVSQLPFPNPVPKALKQGRCWRVKASAAKPLKEGLSQLKQEFGDRLWIIDDLPKDKAIEALALRMELETKTGDAALIFSVSEIDRLDLAAARLRLQAIDCGRNGVVELLPFVIEEFYHARFTQIDRTGWLSMSGDRLLLKVDLPDGLTPPNWGRVVEGFPGVSVHQTGHGGRVQLTPATVLHDQFDFRLQLSERDQWISAQGHALLTVEPRVTADQLESIVVPDGWSLKLTQRSQARP